MTQGKIAKIGKTLQEIEDLFFEKLKDKTGWGRNEIKIIYREAQNEILRKHIDDST